ncbi:MAG: LytTR family transcriptional regulator DNA-binding domain-containing protein [Sphingobacteriaceae bacterium]|nr:LytTR family transcriptional regulator DNA-binding domain-containing protein [Cytophagaceae bacterium]
MLFKTLLIDDEKLALSRLERLLSRHSDTFEIVGTASNGAEGLVQIEKLAPDLIFLDIEMPVLTGFEMLARLGSVAPLVVFATAYDAYAIRAFEENSIDYLLKPIEEERLLKTIQKLQQTQKSAENGFSENLVRLLEQMQPKAPELTSISVKSGHKILLLPLDEVSHFEADDKYVFLMTTDGQKYLTNYTLATLEARLPARFLRVSRSVIVNKTGIKELEKHFSGRYVLTLRDKPQTRVQTGQSFSENIRTLLEI